MEEQQNSEANGTIETLLQKIDLFGIQSSTLDTEVKKFKETYLSNPTSIPIFTQQTTQQTTQQRITHQIQQITQLTEQLQQVTQRFQQLTLKTEQTSKIKTETGPASTEQSTDPVLVPKFETDKNDIEINNGCDNNTDNDVDINDNNNNMKDSMDCFERSPFLSPLLEEILARGEIDNTMNIDLDCVSLMHYIYDREKEPLSGECIKIYKDNNIKNIITFYTYLHYRHTNNTLLPTILCLVTRKPIEISHFFQSEQLTVLISSNEKLEIIFIEISFKLIKNFQELRKMEFLWILLLIIIEEFV